MRQLLAGAGRLLGVTGLIVLYGGLEGCATSECLETRQQQVTREICEQRSSTGFCTARRTETRTQDVCVRRAKPKTSADTERSAAATAAAASARAKLEEEARERNADPYRYFKEKLKAADQHYPPRSFESCRTLEGTWYARCERIENHQCVQASRTEGACTNYFMPVVEDSTTCRARGGYFAPGCKFWEVPSTPLAPYLACGHNALAPYGTCREHVAAAFDARDHVALSSNDGRMVNPRALRPGKTYAAFEREMQKMRGHYPAKNFQSCRVLEGRWYGACTRREGGKCVEASRTRGECFGFYRPEVADFKTCKYDFRSECVRYGTSDKGQVCAVRADYGRCVDRVNPGLKNLHHVDEHGTTNPTPEK